YTVNQLQDDYFTDEDLEESWSTSQNDLIFTHDYIAAMKARNLLEDQIYLEIQDEEDIEKILPEDNNDEKEEHNIDRKIPVIETKKQSPCIIVDNSKREIGRCNSITNLVSLSQLIGTWEIEMNLEENYLTELEVCSSHFNFDHNPESRRNLFGQSAFTTEWEIKFDQIINQLLYKYERNFGIKEIDTEIFARIETECQINPLNVVILKPGPASNSNTALFLQELNHIQMKT
ncbi:2363_t:CDS:2, partial [Ambispora gerdemannii]